MTFGTHFTIIVACNGAWIVVVCSYWKLMQVISVFWPTVAGFATDWHSQWFNMWKTSISIGKTKAKWKRCCIYHFRRHFVRFWGAFLKTNRVDLSFLTYRSWIRNRLTFAVIQHVENFNIYWKNQSELKSVLSYFAEHIAFSRWQGEHGIWSVV